MKLENNLKMKNKKIYNLKTEIKFFEALFKNKAYKPY